MINYIVKVKDTLDYYVMTTNKLLRVGTEFYSDGHLCRIISMNGKM